jgi:hypothetical protein
MLTAKLTRDFYNHKEKAIELSTDRAHFDAVLEWLESAGFRIGFKDSLLGRVQLRAGHKERDDG